MLVVVTIIALFAAVVGTTMFKKTDQARVTAAKLQISNFMDALGQYKLDTATLNSPGQRFECAAASEARGREQSGRATTCRKTSR